MKILDLSASGRTDELIARLLEVWNASVRATHDFLTEEDIIRLAPYAEGGMRGIETLSVVFDEDVPVGFMGVQNQKIEMLFIRPSHFRRGLGKALIEHAFGDLDVRFVDVNEQNPGARAFYERMGFVVVKRNPLDGEGNPFPILEMERGKSA